LNIKLPITVSFKLAANVTELLTKIESVMSAILIVKSFLITLNGFDVVYPV
jgi:hypothetical protein